ncbi:hypothetical protein [Georgenia alba]|uniref:ABC-2 type transport system permease protein n=1 Tax=Georgenia alba TaxID=2233858 RepID=A0ABW2QCH1_9MICO
MVGILIRLRFAIQRHTLRWKRTLGLALGLLGAALTWAAVLAAADPARHDVATLALTFWLVGWVIGPILTSGASVLRPEYFTLLPLDRRRVGFGLLASVFVGVGAFVTALGILATVGYAVRAGSAVAAAVAVVVGLLYLIGVVGLSRAVYAVLGAAMRTALGVEIAAIQYGLLLAALFAGWLVVSPVVSATPVLMSTGLAAIPVAGQVLDALPSGWVVRAIDAAAAGEVGAALGWTALVAAFAAAAVAAATAMLVPNVGGRATRRLRRRPVRPRRPVLPATPLGAVVGKELRTWLRDPWRSLEMRSSIWFGIVLAVLLVVSGAGPWAVWATVAVALMAALSGANLYGQDGTALWQLVVGQSPAAVRADVRGRQIAIVLAMGLPAVLMTGIIAPLTGGWALVPAVLTTIVVLLGVGSGVSALMSVLAVTPGVEPAKRANPNDGGENSLAIQVALWAALLLAAPTVALVVLQVTGVLTQPWLPAAALALALVNGLLAAWGLGRLAVHVLSGRLPETFARLRYPAMRVRAESEGGGFLDSIARAAEKSAHQEREAAEGKKPAKQPEQAGRPAR